MTKLYDGQVAELFLNSTRQNPEIQALSYAILQEKQRIIDNANRTRTLAVIDELPESVLDVLAVELRTPFYTESLTIVSKRELIKGTMIFYSKMGTPEAVNRMLSAVFPGSYIEEWMDYGGSPYHFQVIIETARIRETANATDIRKAVDRCKRLSAHMDGIIYQCGIGIVIATHAQGYKYKSTWTGRHEAGTVPWRNTRGGLAHAELVNGTATDAYGYKAPLTGKKPYRNTRGGYENGAVEIETAAVGWPYTSEAAGRREAGTAPWRNTRGGIASTEIEAEITAEGHLHQAPMTGTKPKRSTLFGAEDLEAAVRAAAKGYRYTSESAGRIEAGTSPQRATRAGITSGELKVEAAAAGYPYTVPSSGKQDTGTYPERNSASGMVAGAFTADADGKGFHYKVKWCGRTYCKS